MPYTLCPIPYALCPMPYALCPIPYALYPMPCGIANSANTTGGLALCAQVWEQSPGVFVLSVLSAAPDEEGVGVHIGPGAPGHMVLP